MTGGAGDFKPLFTGSGGTSRADGSLRALVVTSSYPSRPGDPSGHFVAAEVSAIVARGYETFVLAPGRKDQHPDGPAQVVRLPDGEAFGWPGALSRLQQHPLRSLGVARFVWSARSWIQQRDPFDLVVAHWLLPSAWPIALGSKGPLEVVAHGSDVRLLCQVPPLARFIVRALLARGARFRFVSHELRRRLVRIVGPELERVARTEASPIEIASAPSRTRARQALGVEPAERLIAVVSRLVTGKRLHTALAAACLVPGARVVVVGDGPLRGPLRQAFPQVHFVGRQPRPEALRWMAAADVVVSASHSEGAPTVVREARALGVPVVACPAGDLLRWQQQDPGLFVVGARPGRGPVP